MPNYSGIIRPNRLLRRLDFSLLLLIVILAVMNIPYWDSEFMVGHDTKNTYLIFHYFYNHLAWYGELPQWFPYGEYGYSSLFFQLCNLSPFSYLSGFLGWVMGVKDTLILFKLSVFGDQLVFLFGLHLLSKLLYRHRTTCFIICLLGIGSVVWTWQIYWSLRFFYLLPLALYFYYRFLVERLSWAFWAALLTMLFVFVGGLPYWAPIYFYMFLVMTLIMLPDHWRAFAALCHPGWKDVLLVVVVVGSVVAAGYVMTTCLSGLHNYAPGRAVNGMYTDLKSFMTYNTIPVWQYLHSFIDGTMPNLAQQSGLPDDLNLYIGLLPVGTLLLALFVVREKSFCSLFGGLVAILLLAGSGLSSWALYWIMPAMKTFRHLVLLLEVAKVLLLLSSGFGLDLLISRLEVRGWLQEYFRPFTFLTLLAGLCLILDLVVSVMAYNPMSWNSPMQFTDMLPEGGEWTAVRLAVLGMTLTALFVFARVPYLKKCLSPRIIPLLLVVVCLVDIGTYQVYQWQNRSHGQYVGRLELEPLRYYDSRTMQMTADVQYKYAVITSSPGGAYHSYYANILQNDPCVPLGQVDLFSLGTHELVTARGADPSQRSIEETFLPANDAKLLTVMGCNAPKIRFVTQAEYGKTDQGVTALISSSTDLDSKVILRGDPGQQPVNRPLPELSAMTYRSTFFNANRLDLDVSVKPGFSGWLVYADAFDPHWKAYLDGKEKPVIEAYRAFKAVHLDGGETKVSFRYENYGQKYAMGLLTLVGILLALGCIVGLIWQSFNGRIASES